MIQPAWTNNHGRQYRYYTCSKRIKAGYKKCKLPTLPADEIEALVDDESRISGEILTGIWPAAQIETRRLC
jgi:hypothetical protein